MAAILDIRVGFVYLCSTTQDGHRCTDVASMWAGAAVVIHHVIGQKGCACCDLFSSTAIETSIQAQCSQYSGTVIYQL